MYCEGVNSRVKVRNEGNKKSEVIEGTKDTFLLFISLFLTWYFCLFLFVILSYEERYEIEEKLMRPYKEIFRVALSFFLVYVFLLNSFFLL